MGRIVMLLQRLLGRKKSIQMPGEWDGVRYFFPYASSALVCSSVSPWPR
jgi:hypothetical protein